MRILFLITKSQWGGAQRYVYTLAKRFKEDGYTVGVMAQPGGLLEEKCVELGCDFFSASSLRNNYNIFKYNHIRSEIGNVVSVFKPTVVSCNSGVAGFWGRVILGNKLPVVFTAHGWSFTPGTPILQRCITWIAELLVSRLCRKIICVSSYDKKLAERFLFLHPDRVSVIHNGVSSSPRIELQEFQDGIKIVFVGRLVRQKDPYLLLGAFSEFPESIKNKCSMVIIGDGPERRKVGDYIIEHKLDKHVRLLGNIHSTEVEKVLKNSSIFVLTTRWEGFPYTILEAMAVGLPVIANDVGGVSEAVVDEQTGFLVPRGDKRRLSEYLVKLINDPELRQKMGQAGHKRVTNEFSFSQQYEKTKSIFLKATK